MVAGGAMNADQQNTKDPRPAPLRKYLTRIVINFFKIFMKVVNICQINQDKDTLLNCRRF